MGIKVVLLLLLVRQDSGEFVSFWDPLMGFETLAKCEEVLAKAKESAEVPPGMYVRGKCYDIAELEV